MKTLTLNIKRRIYLTDINLCRHWHFHYLTNFKGKSDVVHKMVTFTRLNFHGCVYPPSRQALLMASPTFLDDYHWFDQAPVSNCFQPFHLKTGKNSGNDNKTTTTTTTTTTKSQLIVKNKQKEVITSWSSKRSDSHKKSKLAVCLKLSRENNLS